MMKKNRMKVRFNVVNVVLFTLLCVYVIGLFVPVLWSVLHSFMDEKMYQKFYTFHYFDEVNHFFPQDKKTEVTVFFYNFKKAWESIAVEINGIYLENRVGEAKAWDLFGNSLMYAVICASVNTLCPCIVAYATARFKFKFSKLVYAFVIVTMSLPIVGSMPSEIRMLDNLGLLGQMKSMGILKFNFLSVYYLILFALFEGIPMDYTEVAKIDGANNWTIMTRVILPQAANMIVTVFILTFITYWNDFQVPLVYVPDYPTVAYFIYDFSKAAGVKPPIKLAATFIMALPIVAVFVVFNKRLRISVAVGGIKG